jgi:hypothetical protein
MRPYSVALISLVGEGSLPWTAYFIYCSPSLSSSPLAPVPPRAANRARDRNHTADQTARANAAASPFTEWIQLTADGQGFELTTPSGQRFTAWGFNYSCGDRLLEDYWDTEWAGIAQDFGEMKSLGANLVRIHLQFAKFMQDPATPDEAALDRLEQKAKRPACTST